MSLIHTVLIHGGGIRSLVATAMLTDRSRMAALLVRDARGDRQRFAAAFEQQLEHYGIDRRFEWTAPDAGAGGQEPGVSVPTALRAITLLSGAAELALHHKAERLIWPVGAGDDMESLARAVEAVQLIEQTIRTAHGGALRIETPLLDLSLRQVIEVGHQMNVPWQLARSCQAAAVEPCGECHGCRARHDAFAAAGIDDPLQLAHTPR